MTYKKYIYYLFLFYFLKYFYSKFKKKLIQISNIRNLFYLPYISLYIKKNLKKVTLSIEDGFNNNYINYSKLPMERCSEEEMNNKIDELIKLDIIQKNFWNSLFRR